MEVKGERVRRRRRAGGEGFKKRGGVGVHFCVGGRREEDGERKVEGVRGERGGEMRGKGG